MRKSVSKILIILLICAFFVSGCSGKDGVDGKDGKDGKTPTISINSDGYWVINGVETSYKVQGQDGIDGTNGTNGINGTTPTISISEEGYWVINGVETSYKAQGQDGIDGTNGTNGINGTTPTISISEEGYWVINGVETTVKAQGQDGIDGINGTTPTISISEEGYWIINGVETSYKAIGQDGITPRIEINEYGYWVINGVVTTYKATGDLTICKGVTESLTGKVPQGNFEKGDEYICEVKPGVSYTFFVLSTDENNVNLILEANINSKGEPVKESTATNKGLVNWNVSGSKTDGPVTAMDFLYNATKDWTNIPNIKINHKDRLENYGGIYTEGNITKITNKSGNIIPVLENKQGYENLKARMHYSSEGLSYANSGLWLYNYLSQHANITGMNVKNVIGIAYYWSLDSSNTDDQEKAALINYDGLIGSWHVDANGGVRPVISIPKYRLK